MTVVLVVLACLGALVGFVFASQATMGVALLAAACLLAIFARIAQASSHHDELKRLLREQRRLGEQEPESPPVHRPEAARE